MPVGTYAAEAALMQAAVPSADAIGGPDFRDHAAVRTWWLGRVEELYDEAVVTFDDAALLLRTQEFYGAAWTWAGIGYGDWKRHNLKSQLGYGGPLAEVLYRELLRVESELAA